MNDGNLVSNKSKSERPVGEHDEVDKKEKYSGRQRVVRRGQKLVKAPKLGTREHTNKGALYITFEYNKTSVTDV